MAEPSKPIHHPMAFCPKHGLFVPRGAIVIAEGATNVNIGNVAIEGYCPKCGGGGTSEVANLARARLPATLEMMERHRTGVDLIKQSVEC
jgi:hypothetical protein